MYLYPFVFRSIRDGASVRISNVADQLICNRRSIGSIIFVSAVDRPNGRTDNGNEDVTRVYCRNDSRASPW